MTVDVREYESDTTAAAASAAVERLRRTFRTGRTRSLSWRERQLRGILRMLDREEPALLEALRTDLDRMPAMGWLADLVSVRGEAAYALKHVRRWSKPRRAGMPVALMPARAWVVPEPKGVVLVIGAWNYPINLALNPVVGALAAGNTVVLKPSEVAPATSALLARLLPAYLEGDAVAVVEGGAEVVQAMIDAPVDHVLFTGSAATGRKILEAAAAHLTPVTLELGGKSPAVVAADADIEVAARRIALGKVTNSGQTCIANDYVLVERSVRDRFVESLVAALAAQTADRPDGLPIVSRRHLQHLRRLAHGHGGRTVAGGDIDELHQRMSPTVIVDPDPSSALMQQEIFGPLLPVITVDSFDQALAFIAERPHPLAAYVFTESSRNRRGAVAGLTAGALIFNHVMEQAIIPSLPFGGIGGSGMGRYHGVWGFETFSHLKPVIRASARPDLDLLYPPVSDGSWRLLRRLLR